MKSIPRQPIDRNGKVVAVGSLVRVLCLSGEWFDRLPPDERVDVESMVGEVFRVEEIDGYGQPWIRKSWPDETAGTCRSHSIALEPREMAHVGSPSQVAMVDHNDFDPQDVAPYEPTEEEAARMRASSLEERAAAEAMVLRECSHRWQKVAKIVGDLLDEFDQAHPGLPLAFLQAAMQKLEDLGKVEIAGDVWAMRYSEIRLAQPRQDALEA